MSVSPFSYEPDDFKTIIALSALVGAEPLIACRKIPHDILVPVAAYIPSIGFPVQCWSLVAMPYTDKEGVYLLEYNRFPHWMSYYHSHSSFFTKDGWDTLGRSQSSMGRAVWAASFGDGTPGARALNALKGWTR